MDPRETKPRDHEPASSTPSVRPEVIDEDAPQAEHEDADVETEGAEAEYAKHADAARAIDARDVKTFTGDAMIALFNVRVGVKAVVAARAMFEQDPNAPKVDFAALEGTVGVAQALTLATRRAERVVVANTGLRAKLSDAAKTRRALLASAVALAEGGVIDASEVARIRKGRGPMDTAQDCIDLAALFRANAARIQGRTTVTAEQLRDAAKLGNELVAALTPAGAKTAAPTKENAPEAEMRDRMAVLLARRYFEVERAAGWLWGRALDEHVPALLARSTSSRKLAKTPEEPPVAPK